MPRIPKLPAPPLQEQPVIAPRLRGLADTTEVSVKNEVYEWDTLSIPVDANEGRHVYRASSLGRCQAALIAAASGKKGAEMPASLLPRLDEGTAMEPFILAMHAKQYGYRAATYNELADLKEAGVIAGYNPVEQQIQVSFDVGSSARVVAHLDRIATHAKPEARKEFYVLEAKAFGKDLWKKWKNSGNIHDFPGYALQLSAQMIATGRKGQFIVGRKEGQDEECRIAEINVQHYDTPPIAPAKLKSMVLRAEAMVQAGEQPPCTDGVWPCAFFKEAFCLGKPPVEREVLDDEGLGNLVALYHSYTQDMADTDEQKEAKKLRDDVKTQMDKYIADAGIARGAKFTVESSVHETFEFEWYTGHVESRSYDTSYPKVKLVPAPAPTSS